MKLLFKDEQFVQRDINWLRFNHRVLQEAKDHRNPLLERLKFLAIFSSNLEEFFRVRVSSIRQIKNIDKSTRKKLKLTPNRTLKTILKGVKEQQEEFGAVFYNEILPELKKHHIAFLNADNFDEEQQQFSKKCFNENLKQHISILEAKDGVLLENAQLYYAIKLSNNQIYFVSIPTQNRFIKLPGKHNTHTFCFVDDIVKHNIQSLFAQETIVHCYEIKLSRDAELYLDDEFEGELAEEIYNALAQRSTGQPTRLLYDNEMPDAFRIELRKILKLGKVDMFPGGTYHNFNDFMGFENPTQNTSLNYEEQPALPHPVLENSTDYFKTVKEKDQILHFPYQKFDYVHQFIEQAANDEKVTAIKISLYRIAKSSHLSDALIKAIENGKEVVIFVEAQARFDEANNFEWGKTFEEKGATVVYSIPNVKVHSKIFLIQRTENHKNVNYAYIGTGNFNEKTAKIYSDHALLTANKKIGKELAKVFEILQKNMIIPRAKHLLVSPFNTRVQFLALIENEMRNAADGKKAKITIKMNSLHDKRMIAKLYEASRAGVEVRLLVRGFSSLLPEDEEVSKHVEMTSIVDRYLEHGRIYLFENDGDEIMYMGSADWMTRNLDYRIEVLTPIYDNDIFAELKDIFTLQLNDNVKARIMDKDFTNNYVENNKPPLRSQYEIYNYLKNKL